MLTTRSIVTPPVLYAVTAAEMESHARATGQPADQLEPYLYAAMDHLETITNRRFLTQTWKAFMSAFPACNIIYLPFAPLASVTHIKYTDTAAVQTTFAASNYGVSTAREPGVIVLEYQKTWPTTVLKNTDPIEIQFVCGSVSAEDVPRGIRQAVLMLASHFYEHREAVMIGSGAAVMEAEMPFAVSALIEPWRIWA